jgi:hypothetical protein
MEWSLQFEHKKTEYGFNIQFLITESNFLFIKNNFCFEVASKSTI